MDNTPYLTFSQLNDKTYETIETRIPDSHFLDLIKPMIPENHQISIGGFWTQINSPNKNIVHYGWKIHISTTVDDAREIIRKTVPCIVKYQVCFKFLSDEFSLRLSLNKNMPRMQVGKFITIYPQSLEQCRLIAKELSELTRGHSGPHILTDHAVDESKNIYVRFGAHTPDYKIDRYGFHIMGYHDENGHWQGDERRLPNPDSALTWKDDHTSSAVKANADSIGPIVIGGRYSINKAIKYHGEGGVYHGIDTLTNIPIIAREQRRGVSGLPGKSGIEPGYTIKKEAKLLKMAEKSGFAPIYIDHFEEDEHWFLVQERLVDFDTLWGFAMNIYYDSQDVTGNMIFERIRSLFISIAYGLNRIHQCGVILRDLTRTNVLVSKSGQIKFIDFEFAHALKEKSPWVLGWTLGYGSPQQKNDEAPSIKDDCYAFGALLLDVLTFCASGLELDRDAILRKLRRNLNDLMLPAQLEEIILGLLDENPKTRWGLARAIDSLESIVATKSDASVFPTARSQYNIAHANTSNTPEFVRDILTGIDDFLKTSMTYSRQDRIWPASPQVWIVNPVCIGYGASGVALYQHRAGTLEPQTLTWIIERTTPNSCPPGFFTGMAGVAWVLADCGKLSQARRIMDDTRTFSENIGPSLYFGLAGIGLTELKLFLKTGDEQHLAHAELCAKKIKEESQEDQNGIYWITSNQTKLGLSEGQAGISFFFLCLYQLTKNIDYLMIGRKALDFDLSQRIETNGQLLWHSRFGALAHEPKTPHMWAGTAGICAVLLRYYHLTQDPEYGVLLDKCKNTLSSRFSNKIWQSEGLAGMVEFHLDMANFFPEHSDAHTSVAWHLAEGIMDHALTLDFNSFKGVAFAGMDHARICADYGYGTAGIGLCLHRLLYKGSNPLFLDEIINPTQNMINPLEVGGCHS